jgi:hypothetical protein
MKRSEQQLKDMAEVLSAHMKCDRLSTSVQLLESEFCEGRTKCGLPPPPPPPHAPDSNSGTGNNPKPRRNDNFIHTRALHLDFPRYDGGDPSGWLYRAEQFFEYHQTQPAHQIRIASFHLEEEALQGINGQWLPTPW